MGPKKKGAPKLDDDGEEQPGPVTGVQGKKGKKGKKGRDDFDDDFKVDLEEPNQVDDSSTVTTEAQPAGKKGKKGKGKKGRDDFDDDFKVDSEEPEKEEESVSEAVDSQPQGKKGKKGKGKKGLDDFNDDSRVDVSVDVDEPILSEEEEPSSMMFGGKKKKKGKKADEDVAEKSKQKEVEDDEEQPEVQSASGTKGKKGKKGRDDFDDDFKVDLEEPAEDADTMVTETQSGRNKGKKGKGKKVRDDFDDDFKVDSEALEQGDDTVSQATDQQPAGKKGKKSKGKKGRDDFDDDFKVDLSVDVDEDATEKQSAKKGKVGKKGKGKDEESEEEQEEGSKKSGKAKSLFDLLVDDEEADENDEAEEEEPVEIMFTGKKKKKSKKAANETVEEAFSEPAEPTREPDVEKSEAGPAASSSKKGKKTKVEEDDDLDAILAQLEAPKDPAANEGGKKKKKKEKQKKEEDEERAEEPGAEADAAAASAADGAADAEEKEETELSAAAKKKKKKKEKEKAKAAERAPAKEEEEAEKEDTSKKGKKGPPVPKHVREMQERLARIQAEEDRRKKEEEERKRKEEEEAARLAEEERKKEEAKRLKKEREKEKLRQAKLAGKPVTAKQKEEARRMQMMRERLLQQGLAVSENGKGSEGADAAPKKPKVVYETKKKRGPAKGGATEDGASEQAAKEEAEAAAAKAAEEAAREAAEAAAREEARKVAEAEAAKAAEAAAKEESEEEEEESWDAKDWDESDVEKNLVKKKLDEEEEEVQETKKPSSPPRKAPSAPTPKATAKPAPRPAIPPARNQTESDSESETDSEEETSSDESEDEDDARKRAAVEKRKKRMEEAMRNRNEDDLRSPICCILGHVDTGKTKLLDKIRNTNVQEGEAGGITQQIGATYFPMDAIRERTKELKADATLKVPGLLIIDTPGHESFTNLRSRGSGLCDIAILVVDIMHGLEPQTIESLNLLKMRKTPFVIALNKVDRLYNWKPNSNAPIRATLKKQEEFVNQEFQRRVSEAQAMLMEQGLNTELYWKNKDIRKTVNIVPTSAISGEGIPDLLLLLVQLTQKMMSEKLMYLTEIQCTVLEVKVIEGLGTTIDVVLVNGVLHEGDTIVVCGLQGPIKTSIRALLTPHPMKELRVKGTYQHHKELKAAQGIKIVAQGLESAVAGTQLYVVGPDDDADDIMEEAMQDMNSILQRVDKTGEGVCVQASTLGSLEALLEFLKSPDVNIPVSGLNIGPIHKKDVMRASTMLERKRKEYAAILAFDVKVTPEARDMAQELGVRIFTADIIYHLFDQFTAYMANIKEEKRKESAEEAVFPCTLKILPNCIFNKKDPIVVGVEVTAGIAKIGTPVCVPSQGFIEIGRIGSMEINHKVVDVAKKGQAVAMKIQSGNPEEAQKMYGRHFDLNDELVSKISRKSIDLLKENYKDDLTREDWMLVVKLKKVFEIQ